VNKFHVGDRVRKLKGYKFIGIVVAVFAKLDGSTRYVVEMDGTGMLHIYSERDLDFTEQKLEITIKY
jgi:hypothetical protein